MAATTRRFIPRQWHAGLLLMLVGTVSVLGGIVQTTVSGAVSQNCPPDATLLAKFEYAGDHYAFEGPDVNRNVVTIADGTGAGGNWHSTVAVSLVIVAGGPGAITTSLNPLLNASHFSNAGLPSSDGVDPDITEIQFCQPAPNLTTTAAGDEPTTVAGDESTVPSTAPESTTSTPTGPPDSSAVDPSTVVPAPTTTVAPTPTDTAPTAITAPIATGTTTTPRVSGATAAPNPAAITASSAAAATTTTTAVKYTVPPLTAAVAGATTSTTVNPSATGSTIPTTISPGGATSTSVYAVLASMPTARLPQTGSSSSALVAIGIVLLGAGLGITVVGSRRERGRARA
jgi:LPXTG-motif cell wall-anchored protein